MSIESVGLFYERLSVDKDFAAKLQGVNQEEFTRIIQAEGYDFTEQEFEDYTAENLDSIDDRELEAIVGGIKGIKWPIPLYGAIPLYGVVPINDQLS